MAANFDASEFIDDDFHTGRQPPGGTQSAVASSNPSAVHSRAPSREELDSRVHDMQAKLADLKREQHEIERQRAACEENRRRLAELTTGRQEMEQHLTRGIGLLQEAEFAARRDAEQMAKVLVEFQEALAKIVSIQEDGWTTENQNVELTRALTIVENARLEWNSARLKFPLLSGEAQTPAGAPAAGNGTPFEALLRERNYAEMCKLGLALTWPIALAAIGIFVVLLLRIK